MSSREWVLPVGVVTMSDVSLLIREIELTDNFLRQNAILRSGATPEQIPKTSQTFVDIVNENKLNMLDNAHRQELAHFLQVLKDGAPILHFSFNGEPSALFLQKLTVWLRGNIHKFAILQIGRHSNIGAGCALRTTNKYFDFSLRQRFKDSQASLIKSIHELKQTAQTSSAAGEPS